MNKLHILGLMKSLGYEPFIPQGTYLQSTMHYIIASFQNKETDPLIYSVENDLGESIRIWNKFYNNGGVARSKWPEEDLYFEDNLYINSDRFVVRVDETSYSKFFSYQKVNSFNRPVIRGVDKRLDLGSLTFALSDIGILFSMYEHPSQKFITEYENSCTILDFTIQKHKLKMQLTKQTLGPYGTSFQIDTAHIFPEGSIWSPRTYDNWS